MTQFFTREGTARDVVAHNDAGHPFGHEPTFCARCGGAGRAAKWAATGYTCYDCGGSGGRGVRAVRLYTADELATLNARRDAQRAKAAAKAAVEAARIAAEREAREAAQRAARAAEIEALPETATLRHWAPQSEFIASILDQYERGPLTERQLEAALAACAKLAANASSDWLGAVGERITVTATVERVHCIRRSTYYEPGYYIISLRDDAGNALTWFTSEARLEQGARVTGTATVKEHSSFRDTRQTVLKNPRFKPLD